MKVNLKLIRLWVHIRRKYSSFSNTKCSFDLFAHLNLEHDLYLVLLERSIREPWDICSHLPLQQWLSPESN